MGITELKHSTDDTLRRAVELRLRTERAAHFGESYSSTSTENLLASGNVYVTQAGAFVCGNHGNELQPSPENSSILICTEQGCSSMVMPLSQ